MPSSAHIERLFIKPAHGSAMHDTATLPLITGEGIAGDINAHPLSVRQVLVTLASQLQELSIAPGALRENIVIADAALAHFCPGSALVSNDVEIRLTMYCEPCRQISHLHGNLAAMVQRRGVLGTVVTGGVLQIGDALTLIPARYPALPDSVQQRFADFVATIPRGRVVRYRDVALALGVEQSFVRALPAYIKRHRNANIGLPLHRIVTAHGQLLATLPDQAAQLAAEGIACDGGVDLARFLWQG